MIEDLLPSAGDPLRGWGDHQLLRIRQLPHSRPMPTIGQRCHELRINDQSVTWRIVCRVDPDAIVILEVFKKSTTKTPVPVIDVCKRRLRMYDDE